MLLNHTGGLLRDRGVAVALVVAKEYVLEARLIARQRDDGVPGRGFDHGVGGALHGQPDGLALVQLLDLFHSLERTERIGRHWRGERDGGPVALDFPVPAPPPHPPPPPSPNNPHPPTS